MASSPTEFRDFDVLVCVFFFCVRVCLFFLFSSGLRFVDTLDRVTGAMDTEKWGHKGLSELCSRLITGA